MKFFKENNDKSEEIPTFPTGDGGIEAVEYGFETIHPSVCPFDFPSFLIHLLIVQPILFRFPPFLGLGHTLGMITWDMSAFLSSFRQILHQGHRKDHPRQSPHRATDRQSHRFFLLSRRGQRDSRTEART